MGFLIVIPMVLGPVIAIGAILYICLVMIPKDERSRMRQLELRQIRVCLNEGRHDEARAKLRRIQRLF